MEKHVEMRKHKQLWTMAEMIEIGNARYDNMLNDKYEEGVQRGIKRGIKKGIQKGIEEGIQRGMQTGKEKGIEEGRLKEARQLIQRLINLRFHVDATEWLSSLNQQQLDMISIHILEASTFEDLQKTVI